MNEHYLNLIQGLASENRAAAKSSRNDMDGRGDLGPTMKKMNENLGAPLASPAPDQM